MNKYFDAGQFDALYLPLVHAHAPGLLDSWVVPACLVLYAIVWVLREFARLNRDQ